MKVFNHVMLGASDIARSKRFYDAVLGELGVKQGKMDSDVRCSYQTEGGTFMIKVPIDGQPATHANGGTVGFKASSAEEVDAWHEAGIANGGTTCEDPPGPRERGGIKVYLAYLRDPFGNKLCAVYRLP